MQVVLGGRERGELALHAGLGLTLLAVTCLVAKLVLPALFPGWDDTVCWLVAAWVALAEAVAGLVHELGHAAVARAHGRHVYRITLYGIAAAARRAEARNAREQLLIAAAGPLSHLLLAAVFWMIWRLIPEDNLPLRVSAALPAATNLVLGVLNLLPLRPLDGGRVLGATARIVALRRGQSPRRLRIVDMRTPTELWQAAEAVERNRAV